MLVLSALIPQKTIRIITTGSVSSNWSINISLSITLITERGTSVCLTMGNQIPLTNKTKESLSRRFPGCEQEQLFSIGVNLCVSSDYL
ncbi:hypothetical protein TNIN_320431 [Trichonephila inaurata madagascariensis]|uniref:Uncharacterized protein n=1 Tax=Trichonephila inaurata madagascariensis TaxID=2747483 RepID=A0A8X6WSZ7_9ARAC|nr:hypothetical protein TNIN_320431 [Trichonephila inaurata madagascariensis]